MCFGIHMYVKNKISYQPTTCYLQPSTQHHRRLISHKGNENFQHKNNGVSMSSRLFRQYSLKDEKLTVLAGVTRDHYIKYQASFSSFNDVVFPEDYHDVTLAEKLTAAKTTMSDAFIVKGQAKETADVEEAKSALLKPMKVLAFVVETRFEQDPVILNEFMLNQLNSKSQNADTLIAFTKDALITVEKYNDELIESGMKPDLVDIIQQACDKLDDQRREQIEVIRSRPGITHERIEKMNDLWKELVKINKAADIIFEEQPEVKALFDLPKASRYSSQEDGELVDEEVVAE